MKDFETAKRFFFEGLQLLDLKNYSAAEIRFAQSLELVPDRVSTLNNLAVIKIKLKQFSAAEQLASRRSPWMINPRKPGRISVLSSPPWSAMRRRCGLMTGPSLATRLTPGLGTTRL